MAEDRALAPEAEDRLIAPEPEPEPERPSAVPDSAAPEILRVRVTKGRLVAFGVFVVSIVAFLYFVLPKLLGLKETWNRIEHGNPWWFALAAFLEVLSFASYVALFRGVFVRDAPRIGWRESYQITMASLAATRVFAAGGAGGIALTAWALRRAGLGPRTVAARMLAFLILLYGVYMAAFVIGGLGLYLGLFPGPAPFAITVVPAIFGAVVIGLFLALAGVPADLERVVARWTSPERWHGRTARWLAATSATARTGVRMAISLVRTRDWHLLGAVGWWAFDISVLWACFHAFGNAPPKAVIVIAYFVGMLGNTLPLPGGIGGVDGGMIGAFTAFGVNAELSLVSVLAYRAFAFWLPTLPGAVAYVQLRRTVHRWRRSEVPSYT
jgi:uncharacterized protein (TIRG00374 family)